MINHFTDWKEWKAAAHARGLVTRVSTQHEGMHEDDMWEPCWAYEPSTDDEEGDCLGVFQNEPLDPTGTGLFVEYTCSGFLCDTCAEFIAEMHKDDDPPLSPA